MKTEGPAATLRIYVSQHCWACQEAMRLAREVEGRYAGLSLELIDLGAEGGRNVDDVFAVPTYVLNGRTLSLGNPTPGELFSHIERALA